ncbi:MAG: SAM-dependent methyltransferase [Acidobacteriaceae bacterium]
MCLPGFGADTYGITISKEQAAVAASRIARAQLQEKRRVELRDCRTVPERTYRIWLLYMAGSAYAFQEGNIELYQVLLARRPGKTAPNFTMRENWYQGWTTAASKAAVW